MVEKYQQVAPNKSPSAQRTEAGGLPGLHNETSQKTKSGMKITVIRLASHKYVQQARILDRCLNCYDEKQYLHNLKGPLYTILISCKRQNSNNTMKKMAHITLNLSKLI